jgi:hypothetical protein
VSPKCPVVVHVKIFFYLVDYSNKLIVRYYFDNVDYNTKVILMHSKTPTCL